MLFPAMLVAGAACVLLPRDVNAGGLPRSPGIHATFSRFHDPVCGGTAAAWCRAVVVACDRLRSNSSNDRR
jgi:hypothetical protein